MNREKNIILIGSFALVLSVIVGYLVVIAPLLTKIHLEKTEYEDAKVSLAQATQNVNSLEIYRTQQPAVSALNDEVISQFPATADVSELTQQISNAALSAGLPASAVSSISTTLPSIIQTPTPATAPTDTNTSSADGTTETTAPTGATATPDPSSAPLASMDVSIAVSGEKSAVLAFLNNLRKIDRVLLVTDVSMSTGNDGKSQVSIKATTYLHRLTDDVQPVDSNTTTPKQTSSPTAEPTNK